MRNTLTRRNEPSGDPRRKLSVVREAARGAYPTADLPEMLRQIERGYAEDPEP